MQQLDALAIFQGHAQRQEQIPAVGPLAIGIELAGAGIRQVAGIEQRRQRLVIAVRHPGDLGVELIVVIFHQHLGIGVTVALYALAQVVSNGLLQRPVAKADHAAIVGVGEEAGDALGAAQFHVDIGVDGGA